MKKPRTDREGKVCTMESALSLKWTSVEISNSEASSFFRAATIIDIANQLILDNDGYQNYITHAILDVHSLM